MSLDNLGDVNQPHISNAVLQGAQYNCIENKSPSAINNATSAARDYTLTKHFAQDVS